jgi:excinuclease ABC subunit B
MAYNEEHGITPQSVKRAVQESLHTILRGGEDNAWKVAEKPGGFSLSETLRELEAEMIEASSNLDYEAAALLRDQIAELKEGTGLTKIEPKQRPALYPRQGRKTKQRG